MKAILIINEQHKLLPEQESILQREYDTLETLKVPATGWTLGDMRDVAASLEAALEKGDTDLVFVSPIPYLVRRLGWYIAYLTFDRAVTPGSVRLFHNDRREKKELPNGRVIMTVAREGWQLI